MLMVSELLRAARDPKVAERLLGRRPERFSAATHAVPVVVWNLVGHCNLTCPHCYASASKRPSGRDLDTQAGKKLLEGLARSGTKIVIFSGGEPLLREDLFELAAYARGLGLGVQLSTNGVLVDDAVAGRLRDAGVQYVGISIDGQRSFNDRYRGMDGGFERAGAGLLASKRAGLKTGLRMTLSQLNAGELWPLFAHATELGVDRFYVSHLLYSGRASRMGKDDLAPSESRRILEQLFARALAELAGTTGPDIVTGGNDSDGPLFLAFVRGALGAAAAARVEELLRLRGGNSAGEKILNIDATGEVHPDQFWRAVSLGNVLADPLEQILAHPLRKQLREREKHLEGRCGRCRFKRLCRGSHRERALARFGDVWASDPACVMSDAEIELPTEREAVAP